MSFQESGSLLEEMERKAKEFLREYLTLMLAVTHETQERIELG